MYITELKLKNYGKFNEKEFKLDKGINIIYGENESGKTTIFSFIKSMFFGLQRQRGLASRNDEYSVYEPWDNAAYYEGSLKFNCAKRHFRIERGFNKANKYSRLVNEDDGEELDIDSGDLYNILEGMTENIFLSAITSTTSLNTMENLKEEFTNYTANCANLCDNPINVDMALNRLRAKRKEYENIIQENERKIQAKQSKAEGELLFLKADIEKKKEQFAKNSMELKKREKEIKHQLVSKKIMEIKDIILCVIIFSVTMLIGYFMDKIVLSAVIALLICFAKTIYNIFNKNNMKKNISKVYDRDSRIQYLRGILVSLGEDIKEKQTEYDSLENEIEEMDIKKDELKKPTNEIRALDLAYNQIKEAVLDIQRDTMTQLNQKASEVYNKFTNGRYDKISIDNNFNASLNTPYRLVKGNRISRGAKDELDFSIKLAASDMFFQNEKMPIILDDAFVMYDDYRLESVLEYICSMNRQVIIFTCHKREKQILDSKGIPYNFVKLTA